MRKIVINKRYGGYSLSNKAVTWLQERGMKEASKYHGLYSDDISRDNPLLVECVETLGDEANGECATLAIIEIPEDVNWHIEDYDGIEWVAENHRTWR